MTSALLAARVLGWPAGFAQGISSRGVKAQPRGKPSGRPFLARFTDVGAQAGLTQPVVYGGVDAKSYIIEVVGCGVAFLDYDNDGWLDLFVLSGTRLEGAPPGATNRLYKNNRDGTFTDVTEKAGLSAHGLGIGRHGRRLRQRRIRRSVRHLLRHNVLYQQQRRRHVHRCDRAGGSAAGHGPVRVRLHLGRLRPRRAPGSVRRDLPRIRRSTSCRSPARTPTAAGRACPVNCGPRGLPPGSVQLFHNNGDGTFTDVSRQSGVAAATGSYPMTAVAADYDNDGWPDIYVACDSTPELAVPQSARRHVPRRRRSSAAWR